MKKKKLVKRPTIIRVKLPVVPRNLKITQRFLGKYFLVHNGKTKVSVLATTARLGTKFGDYVFTRRVGVKRSKK